MLPKLSAPLVKDVRTGEGIFEWLAGLAIAASAVTDQMSYAKGATYVAILAGIKAARRCVLKLAAVQGAAGIGAPISPAIAPVTDDILRAVLRPDDPALDSSVKAGPAAPENVAQGA